VRHFVAAALLAACASAPRSPRGTAPEAYAAYLEGRLALERGDGSAAAEAFGRAADVEPDEPELRIAAAEALILAGRLPSAKIAADAIVADWPEDSRAFVLLGRVRVHLGDVPGGTEAFERATKLDPTNERAYLFLGSAYRHLGRPDEALTVYRRMVLALPDAAEGHYRLGEALAARRRHVEAADELARAIAIDPDHLDARLKLAEVARRQGEPLRASEILRTAFQRSNENAYVGERLFRVLLEAGLREDALEILRTLDGAGRELRVRLRVAHFLLALQRPDEALAIADDVLGRVPGTSGATLLRSQALSRVGRTDEAVRGLLAVLPDTEGFADARAYAGELQSPNEGLPQIEEAIRLERSELGRRKLVLAQAALLERQGSLARARALLDTVAHQAPADTAVAYARARMEERSGDPETAVAVMLRILARDPANVLALNFVGLSYADRGVRLDDSERLLRRAVELSPDDGNVLDSFGWLLVQRGDLIAAADALERADRLAPYQPEILYHLGELYIRRGDAGRARDAFLQALSLSPDGAVKRRLEERVRNLDARTSR
jgi:tetratricopeptide (TPR) repeat protein